MDKLDALIKYARSKGLPVTFVGNKVLYDYAAMNPEAARVMGFHDKGIELTHAQSKEQQTIDLRHELIEYGLMKAGQSYADAHTTALKLEKVNIPPVELDALAKVGSYKVSHVHDDGDLTIKQDGREFVVTTEGKVFKGTKPEVKEGESHHILVEHINPLSHPHGHRVAVKEHHHSPKSQFRSHKMGRVYHTPIGNGTVLSRKPLGKRSR